MSMKSWLRKVLGVEPQIIERTTFIYPKTVVADEVNQVLLRFNNWFHFSNVSMYNLDDYEGDIFKCASDLLGPTKAKETVKAIVSKWGIGDFFKNEIPEGKVVVDYINSDQKILDAFHKYHHTKEKISYDIDEESFAAYEKLSAKLLDLKMVNYDLAEDIEVILEFVKEFTRSEVKEKKSD